MSQPEAADPYAVAPMTDSLRALARRGVLLHKRKGAQIINEGDVGDTIFIVLQGRLRAYGASAERDITYAEYGPGEYVGEMSLDGGPRSANVEVTQPALLALVTRATLEQHLKEDPAFAFELLTKVIWRARVATTGLRMIALNDVYGRLRARLLDLAVPQPDGSRLVEGPTHQELASMLGCTREMISRVFKELVKGGYVEMSPRRFRLLRPLPAKW